MVSARIPMAPIGVFSSWETFATKSLLTASTRRVAASSSAMTRTRPPRSGITRARSPTFSIPGGRSWMMVPRYSASVLRTRRTRSSSPGNPTRVPRASPMAIPRSFTLITSSWGPIRTLPRGSTSTRSIRSSRDRSGACGAGSDSSREKRRPMVPALHTVASASTAPARAARTRSIVRILLSEFLPMG